MKNFILLLIINTIISLRKTDFYFTHNGHQLNIIRFKGSHK